MRAQPAHDGRASGRGFAGRPAGLSLIGLIHASDVMEPQFKKSGRPPGGPRRGVQRAAPNV